jgi:hypothetical protein
MNEMTKNLLALLLALQKAELDDDTKNHLLPQLGAKLATFSEKQPNSQDWDNVQTKLNDILDKNSSFAQYYQQISTQLQTWTDEDLKVFLPHPDLLASLQSKGIPTLGYRPGVFSSNKDELENYVVIVTQTILRHEKPTEVSKQLLQPSDKLMNQPPSPKNPKK